MVSISAVVASAFIGAVATGLITLLVRELREALNTRRDRERFREALIGEIEAGKYNIGPANFASEAGGGMVPTSVYDSGTEKLGYLSEGEIRAVTTYYARAEKVNALANRIALHHSDVRERAQHGESELAAAFSSHKRDAIDIGDEAISELDENKSEIGLGPYVRDFLKSI